MTRSERGLSESVQWAVLWPLLLLCLVGVIQGGVWLNGRSAARSAAGAGADVAVVAGPGAAKEAALRVASQADLRAVEVLVVDRGASWEVTVTGRVAVFLDVGQGIVSALAVAAKESQ